MSTTLTETAVLDACRTLFGQEPVISGDFLHYLQPSGARSIYRKRAKETHPDFFYTEDLRVQQLQAELFRDILDAYEIINRFFKEREMGLWTPSATFKYSAPGTRRTENRKKHSPRSHADTAANATPKQHQNDYYRGPVPYRVLELGRYLYYTGHIPYWSLIQAITWQRRQRPVIGSVALHWGWLPKGAFDRILAANDIPGRFGERAVRLGLLSDFQVRTLLYYQRTQQEKIGTYFIQQNLVSADQLELLIKKLAEHNALVHALQKQAPRPRSHFS